MGDGTKVSMDASLWYQAVASKATLVEKRLVTVVRSKMLQAQDHAFAVQRR
jgi:hypothetical protein